MISYIIENHYITCYVTYVITNWIMSYITFYLGMNRMSIYNPDSSAWIA